MHGPRTCAGPGGEGLSGLIGLIIRVGQGVAQQPAGYSGQGFSLRGEKGRYVLPPAFRNAIGEDRTLCVVKHDRWPCLRAFGRERTLKFEELLDREEEAALRRDKDFDRELRSMQLWGFTEIPFDASGRFVLPDHLAELGNLEGSIFFQGAGEFLTLWDPATLNEMGAGWEGAQATCRKLAADAAKKGGKK